MAPSAWPGCGIHDHVKTTAEAIHIGAAIAAPWPTATSPKQLSPLLPSEHFPEKIIRAGFDLLQSYRSAANEQRSKRVTIDAISITYPSEPQKRAPIRPKGAP
jgi:hypothetical protein